MCKHDRYAFFYCTISGFQTFLQPEMPRIDDGQGETYIESVYWRAVSGIMTVFESAPVYVGMSATVGQVADRYFPEEYIPRALRDARGLLERESLCVGM